MLSIRRKAAASAPASTRRGVLGNSRGATAVEVAFLMPVFLLFALGIIEFARVLWIQTALQNAVEAAARCATVNSTTTCNTTSNTQSYAAAQVVGASVTSSNFTVTSPSCGTQVAASYAFTFVVPNLLPWNLTLTAQSCHP